MLAIGSTLVSIIMLKIRHGYFFLKSYGYGPTGLLQNRKRLDRGEGKVDVLARPI